MSRLSGLGVVVSLGNDNIYKLSNTRLMANNSTQAQSICQYWIRWLNYLDLLFQIAGCTTRTVGMCAALCPLEGLWGSKHFNFSLRFPGDYKRKDGIRIQFDQNLVFVMIFKSSMNKIAIYIKIRIIKCVYNLPGLWSTWQIFIHDWVNSHLPAPHQPGLRIPFTGSCFLWQCWQLEENIV